MQHFPIPFLEAIEEIKTIFEFDFNFGIKLYIILYCDIKLILTYF